MRKGEERKEKIKEVEWERVGGGRERVGEEQEERKRSSTRKNILKKKVTTFLHSCAMLGSAS